MKASHLQNIDLAKSLLTAASLLIEQAGEELLGVDSDEEMPAFDVDVETHEGNEVKYIPDKKTRFCDFRDSVFDASIVVEILKRRLVSFMEF